MNVLGYDKKDEIRHKLAELECYKIEVDEIIQIIDKSGLHKSIASRIITELEDETLFIEEKMLDLEEELWESKKV